MAISVVAVVQGLGAQITPTVAVLLTASRILGLSFGLSLLSIGIIQKIKE